MHRVNGVFVCQHCFSGFPHFVGHTLQQTSAKIHWKTMEKPLVSKPQKNDLPMVGVPSYLSYLYMLIHWRLFKCLLRPKYPLIECFFLLKKRSRNRNQVLASTLE